MGDRHFYVVPPHLYHLILQVLSDIFVRFLLSLFPLLQLWISSTFSNMEAIDAAALIFLLDSILIRLGSWNI